MTSTLNEEQRELFRAIRKTALDTLARREHSTLELKRKLDKKFGFTDLTHNVIEQLASEKLLSDERFAESYVNYRSGSGFGPQRIARELGERGVNDTLARTLVTQDMIDWLAIAQHERKKKFGETAPLEKREKIKQIKFLQYRGFPFDIIDQVVGL